MITPTREKKYLVLHCLILSKRRLSYMPVKPMLQILSLFNRKNSHLVRL